MESKVIEQRSCELQGKQIHYRLSRSSRKTLGITVTSEGLLKVSAPREVSVEEIEQRLIRRRRWILRNIEESVSLPPPLPERQWVGGESHQYLGRNYRLRIRSSDELRVRLLGGFFLVDVPDAEDREQIQKLMERWYVEHAVNLIQRRLDQLVETSSPLRLRQSPPLLVRKMSKRWGSCSPSGRILVNREAIKLPLDCLDYVLTHELCHLKHPHHGKEFWMLLRRLMPDWKRRKYRLDRFRF